ncbi:hypothetical protein KK083_19805 [Fulvivirgaceae bacterium PWU4]|uniref:Uncharacterized protein n=1 Tax=Chryseosolibacter histidini TaxID=2782349 RepID=A0AAP2DML3_9BACT|nr:hypothetical protein [Chryseosolibacter histidini]MBT1699151.1 hypothetical protein [Chryseosolibacter histidini]
MLATRQRKAVFAYLLMIPACLWLYGCDVLEPDVDPDNPQVQIIDKELYVTPNGSGYIDLYSMVKTQGTVRLDIVSQPRRGNLTEMGKGLFQYTAGTDFRKGTDAFTFQIYSKNNTLLKEDSVVIVVEPDTTHFPQGFYPQDDIAYNIVSEITIDVLANDVLGANRSQVGIEIYRPGPDFPPHAGVATVTSGNMIWYSPRGAVNGYDSIFYKVFSLADPSKFGIAKVLIAPAPSCWFQLVDDDFVFGTDTLRSDTVWLNVFQNDELCSTPVRDYQFEILDDGSAGTAFYDSAGGLGYRLPEQTYMVIDSVRYRMCYRQQCQTAKARIKLKS